jgi:selenide,water dikinase
LAQVLRHLPPVLDAQALVGAALADDAAVYQLNPDLALVATVDYITPVVDDPFVWGGIAAANALSDVYAMGATPILALNLVNFPRDTLPLSVLEQVIQGGAAKVAEAGVAILGGHSVDDPEPKYGLVALGTVHPNKVMRNVGARPGDALVLTKPLGIGILTTAIKRSLASEATTAAAVEIMSTLNRAAGEAMLRAGSGVHAATDVTGFGLLGHLSEMLGDGTVGARVALDSVPVLAEAWSFAEDEVVPGGSRRNLASIESFMDWSERITPMQQLVLADAQTSGGLLIAVPEERQERLLAALNGAKALAAAVIGRVTGEDSLGRIRVRA